MRWALRVTYPSGEEAWLRHGARVGEGMIVQFSTRKLAEINAELIKQGLDEGSTVSIVRRPQQSTRHVEARQATK